MLPIQTKRIFMNKEEILQKPPQKQALSRDAPHPLKEGLHPSGYDLHPSRDELHTLREGLHPLRYDLHSLRETSHSSRDGRSPLR